MSLKYDASIDGSQLDEEITPTANTEFRPQVCVRVETESSLWWIVPGEGGGGKYLRSPKVECDREQIQSIEGRLDDGRWSEYEYARWSNAWLKEGDLRLNIKPVVGPEDGFGIFTGVVLRVSGFSELSSASLS